MKIHWSPRSPFVRKAMVVIHELGLADRVETIPTPVAMSGTNPELMRHNPLSKLPTLILDDGSVIYDSHVICEYLDSEYGGNGLFPKDSPERLQVLRWHDLGDGALELLVLRLNEKMRDAAIQSADHISAFEAKIASVFDYLESEIATIEKTPINMGHLVFGVALSYSDFRYGEWDWRADRPNLAAWHAAFAERPSMKATEPRME